MLLVGGHAFLSQDMAGAKLRPKAQLEEALGPLRPRCHLGIPRGYRPSLQSMLTMLQ